MDVALKRLPDPLTLPSYVIEAVLLGAAAPFTGGGGGRLGHALIGMALWALFAVQWLVLPKAIGRGDVKLAGVLGLLPRMARPGRVAPRCGRHLPDRRAGGTVALLVTRRAERGSELPYGPFLLLGTPGSPSSSTPRRKWLAWTGRRRAS